MPVLASISFSLVLAAATVQTANPSDTSTCSSSNPTSSSTSAPGSGSSSSSGSSSGSCPTQRATPTPMRRRPRPATTTTDTTLPSISHDGNGWCVFADDTGKQSFYSSVFPGDPDNDVNPREDAFQAYITLTYPERTGMAVCTWDEWSTESEAEETEREAESSDQIKGYQMTETQWKPGQDE